MASVSTYAYKKGRIAWNGMEMNAVIIAGLPREGAVAPVVASRILAENEHISAEPAVWAVFTKRPRHMAGVEWEFLGSGSGTRALPGVQLRSRDIPEYLIGQLERIFDPELTFSGKD